MESIKKLAITLLTVALTLASGSASATNGYFTHGTGTKNKGMAGAGIAMPEDAIAMANNPAAALFTTGRIAAGAALFSPRRSYKSSASQLNGTMGTFTIGPNNIDSARDYFVIPHVAYAWKLSEESALGVAFYGRGGMNTEWDGGSATLDPDGPGPAPVTTFTGTFGGGTAGVDFSQAFLDLTYARKAGDNFAWGVSLVSVVQTFKAKGLIQFSGFTESFVASGFTQPPQNLTSNGHDYAFGVGGKFGFQAELSPTVSLAAMYQTEISMGEFDDYADLFAEQGGFDIPANAKVGLTFRPTDTTAVSLDVEHTWFSEVAAVGNSFSNLFNCPSLGGTDIASCLGGDNGAGFGWDDMTTYKVGIEWGRGSDMVWRAGISHGEQPIKSSEVMFNILAPAVIEDHITFGFTKKMRQGNELSVALMYAPNGDVTGPNPFDPTQSIKIEMYQWEVEVGYRWGN
ncbi:MAG: outer membrane protein transport protein [Proteobacteria bacterium]|nr:outer membrane protein transport protein [Pseudomonadota bacterium]